MLGAIIILLLLAAAAYAVTTVGGAIALLFIVAILFLVELAQNHAVDMLQPDLINSGGITGVKTIADIAARYRTPICMHNVSGLALDMASQQLSAAIFNCPWLECVRNADRSKAAASNAPVIAPVVVAISKNMPIRMFVM